MSLTILFCILLSVCYSIDCKENEVFARIHKYTEDNPDDEFYQVRDHDSLVAAAPLFEKFKVTTTDFCFSKSANLQYQLVLFEWLGRYWSPGSYIQIEGELGNTVINVVMTEHGEQPFDFSLYYGIKTKTDEWLVTSGSVSGSWMQYDYDDSSWILTALSDVKAEVSGTQFYRKRFSGLPVLFGYRDNMPDGPVTSTTLATGTYSSIDFHSIIRPGNEVSLSQSILAVEIHFTSLPGSEKVEFEAFLAILAPIMSEKNCFNYPYIATDSPIKLNDYYIDSGEILSTSELPFDFEFPMSKSRAYLNGFRIWPYTDPEYAPTSISLLGASSLSSNTWTTTITASNIQYESMKFKELFGYFSTDLFPVYKLRVNSGSLNEVYLYEVQPLICNLEMLAYIEFENNVFNFYARYQTVHVKPVVTEFKDCQITPTPTAGLTFDSATCFLSGISINAITTIYTVSSVMGGHTYTGQFTLQITECGGSVIHIRRVYQVDSVFESFSVIDETSQQAVLNVAFNSDQEDYSVKNYILYLSNPRYSVSINELGAMWQYSSYVYVNSVLNDVNDVETILRVNYQSRLPIPTTYEFNPQYTVKPLESWHYNMGTVPSNWYGSDMSWPTTYAGNYPASTNQIQLYKKEFTVSSLTDIGGIVLSIKYQYGVLVYLNGNEVFRKGFSGDLSTSKYSNVSLPTANYRQISLPINTMGDNTTPSVHYIITGTNRIAIALVAQLSTQTASTFDCAIRLMGSDSVSRAFDYTTATQGFLNGDSSMMDATGELYTKHPSTTVNSVEITFNDDCHEWISSVVINSYYSQSSNQPTQFLFKARNPEDSSWTLLKTVTYLPDGLTLNSTTGEIIGVATSVSNITQYTIYGENPLGITSTTIDIAVRIGECKAEGLFPKTLVGERAYYECATGGAYIGTQERVCILGEKDGEWQKVKGTCIPTFVIYLVIILVVIIIAAIIFILVHTRKRKASRGTKNAKHSGSTKKTLPIQSKA